MGGTDGWMVRAEFHTERELVYVLGLRTRTCREIYDHSHTEG